MDAMIGTVEMTKRAGCSYRQLDYWIRLGILAPAISANGSGSQRRFTEEQVRVVRLVADLAVLGATEPVLRRAATSATALEASAWTGLGFVDVEGRLLDWPRTGSCWAIDLERCAAAGPAVPASDRALVSA